MKFDVDKATMNYLEGIWFDFIGYRVILQDILFTYKDNLDYIQNVDNCEYFLNEYKETNRKLELIKSEIVREYVPYEFRNDRYDCEFLFDEYAVKVVEKGCACHV